MTGLRWKGDPKTSTPTTGRYAKQEADKLLRRLSAQIARALKSPGPAEIHDLRVATRRFRRILAVLKPCFSRDESKRLRRGLKEIMMQAGTVRDQDIVVHLLGKISVPESDPLMVQARQDREAAARALISSLRRWAQLNLPSEWRKAGKSATGNKADQSFYAAPIDATARRILPPVVTEFFRRGKDASHAGVPARVIHKFRIAGKNLRYTIDFLTPIYGDSLAGLSSQLKNVQDLLGDINDIATVEQMLSETAGKTILASLKKLEDKKKEEFRRDYAPMFSSAAVRRQWKHAVRGLGSGAAAEPFTDKRRPA